MEVVALLGLFGWRTEEFICVGRSFDGGLLSAEKVDPLNFQQI